MNALFFADPGVLIPPILVCMLSAGMSVAFFSADYKSPASRALALALVCISLSIGLNVVLPQLLTLSVTMQGWFSLPEALAMMALAEWVLRVRRTLPAEELDTQFGDRLLRFSQGFAAVYFLISIVRPALRNEYFLHTLESTAIFAGGFWLFMTPILVSGLLIIFAIILLLNRKPDVAEGVRVLAMVFAIPFFGVSFILPSWLASVSMVVGLVIFMIGATHYHVLQGSRGQFMAQFLSPQVADMVRSRGLNQAMRQDFLEISVVCIDLRGFTQVAEGTASTRVIRILREYYDSLGEVFSEYGGTIKDQAGDGLLVLVGAPLKVEDHARRALIMAQRARVVGLALKQRWSKEGIWLGIGIGVATGFVTTGVIGARTRLEYTAVGAAVNLASRLCQLTEDGQIFASPRTLEHCGESCSKVWEQKKAVELKGFSEPIAYYEWIKANKEFEPLGDEPTHVHLPKKTIPFA